MPDSPLFVKLHDFNVWLLPRTLKFPREYRFSFALRLQNGALDLQRVLVAAAKVTTASARAEALTQADIALADLRLLLRLATDLKLLDVRGYAHAAHLTEEIGRLLGAWKKKPGTSG